jgi:hypothetical protein
MVVVRITRPSVSTTTDKAMKPAAYGFTAKPSTAPTYPVQVASISGKGRYRILIAGDGDNTATFRVYVDGSATPVDVAPSDAPAIVEGTFNTGVTIRIEGSGLHSTYTYEVWVEQDYVTSVTIS